MLVCYFSWLLWDTPQSNSYVLQQIWGKGNLGSLNDNVGELIHQPHTLTHAHTRTFTHAHLHIHTLHKGHPTDFSSTSSFDFHWLSCQLMGIQREIYKTFHQVIGFRLKPPEMHLCGWLLANPISLPTLIQRHYIDFLDLNYVETTLFQPVFAQWDETQIIR